MKKIDDLIGVISFGSGPIIQLIGFICMILTLFKKNYQLQQLGIEIFTVGLIIKYLIILIASADSGHCR